MSGNSFGKLFKITTCGESHGGAVGVIVDGCPAGLALAEPDIQSELDRRKPGQSHITSPRKEQDHIHILSGVFEGKTTGPPILLLAYNDDMRPEDYAALKDLYRPSHADFTYQMKYGCRDFRGSEHNDCLQSNNDQISFCSNHAGGTLGGISTGQDIHCRVAFKLVATIAKEQQTVTIDKQATTLAARGRHDPCVLPRAVPIVEAMAALVIMDHYLRDQARAHRPGSDKCSPHSQN